MKLLDNVQLIAQSEVTKFNYYKLKIKGLLLLRVRDELKMTLSAYYTLY